MDAAGRYTISRVPRTAVVAAVVAVAHLAARALGVEQAAPDDLEPLVTSVVDGALALATLVVVVRTWWSVRSPKEEHDGGEMARELHDAVRIP